MNHTSGHAAMHIAKHAAMPKSGSALFEKFLIDLWHAYPIPCLVLAGLILLGNLIANWRIVGRAGYPAVWSLMLLVPFVNILFLLGLAWHPWPIEGKKR